MSWQIVPPILGKLPGHADEDKSGRVTLPMLNMDKLNINGLPQARTGWKGLCSGPVTGR